VRFGTIKSIERQTARVADIWKVGHLKTICACGSSVPGPLASHRSGPRLVAIDKPPLNSLNLTAVRVAGADDCPPSDCAPSISIFPKQIKQPRHSSSGNRIRSCYPIDTSFRIVFRRLEGGGDDIFSPAKHFAWVHTGRLGNLRQHLLHSASQHKEQELSTFKQGIGS